MYISKVQISNFRSFEDEIIEFNDGINVIIGHNNAGKTNLLKSLGLIFDNKYRYKPDVDDFNKNIPIETYLTKNPNGEFTPPKIKVSVYITESTESKNESSDDSNVIYDWRIQVEPYVAKLTYEFFLPDGEIMFEYQNDIAKISKVTEYQEKEFWSLMKRKYMRKYISRIYGGDESLQRKANTEELNRFDYQFLDAIRDVETQLFTGKNTLLKDVLNYFLDYDLKDTEESKRMREVEKRTDEFKEKSSNLINTLKGRIETAPMLEYAKDVGASIEGAPGFEGEITEVELFSALRLIVEKATGIKIPATKNGLGYNNLIYMSILLSKMQMQSTDYVSEDEQKVFPMLLIEEPEAHLHPSMQFKFLRFLKKVLNDRSKVRQVFITTHSTHITSAVELGEIIILNNSGTDKLNITYPSKVFVAEGKCQGEMDKSKAYVKRFLDATKSDMLFSKSTIFVEGITEQILLPCLTNYVTDKKGKPFSLEDEHVSVVNINGRYFNHFLRLFDFDAKQSVKQYSINKRVSCLTDTDPTKRKKVKNAKDEKCYPFELNSDTEQYTYKSISAILNDLNTEYCNHSNIQIFNSDPGLGKTFEYELAFANPTCKLLLTDFTSNKKELEKLMDLYEENASLSAMLEEVKYSNLVDKIAQSPSDSWSKDILKKALIAARYLMSVESNKGEHALALELQLRKNLEREKPEKFTIPKYIENAIRWVCNGEDESHDDH